MFEFLTRPGCHLCDQARPLVLAEVARRGGSVREVDIDTDDRLIKEFGSRIPVLRAPGGELVAEGLIDRRSIRRGLRGIGSKSEQG